MWETIPLYGDADEDDCDDFPTLAVLKMMVLVVMLAMMKVVLVMLVIMIKMMVTSADDDAFLFDHIVLQLFIVYTFHFCLCVSHLFNLFLRIFKRLFLGLFV